MTCEALWRSSVRDASAARSGRRLRELGWKIGAVVTQSEASARKAVRFIGAGRPRAACHATFWLARLS